MNFLSLALVSILVLTNSCATSAKRVISVATPEVPDNRIACLECPAAAKFVDDIVVARLATQQSDLALSSWDAGGSGANNPNTKRQKDIAECNKIGRMRHDQNDPLPPAEVFSCTDFQWWWLMCMKRLGHEDEVHALDVYCENCSTPDRPRRAHGLVVYLHPNGKYCPGEPQNEDDLGYGKYSTCCRVDPLAAANCAADLYCKNNGCTLKDSDFYTGELCLSEAAAGECRWVVDYRGEKYLSCPGVILPGPYVYPPHN